MDVTSWPDELVCYRFPYLMPYSDESYKLDLSRKGICDSSRGVACSHFACEVFGEMRASLVCVLCLAAM